MNNIMMNEDGELSHIILKNEKIIMLHVFQTSSYGYEYIIGLKPSEFESRWIQSNVKSKINFNHFFK